MTLAEELRFDMNRNESISSAGSLGDSCSASAPPPSGLFGSFDSDSAHDSGLFGVDELDGTFQLVLASLRALPATDAIATIGRYGRMLTAAEADIIAEHRKSGATPRETEKLIDHGGKRSKRDRKQRAKRGETLRNNPDLKDDIETGAVSEEQLDDLANADDKTGGAASRDADLIDEIRNSNPDQSKDTIRDFVNNHNKPDAETEHERQRRLRKVSRFRTKDGLEAIMAEGDKATIDSIWNLIKSHANELYRKDGGRDIPLSKHPRTSAQRMFDAFAQRCGGQSAGTRASAGGTSSGGGRPAIVIGATLSDDGEIVDPHLFGSGPLPQSVFERYFCNATVTGSIFGGNGQPLWQGRNHRRATPAQYVALTARDGGCVLCRAHPQQCEAHHILPWNAPGKGKTDITNLALLCPDCHHMVHETEQTLFQDAKSRWKLRPATPEETAPKHKPPP